MHICFITQEYPLPGHTHGGVGSFVKTLAEGLVKSGHFVSVIGADYSPHGVVIQNGVKIYALGISKWRIGKFFDNSRKINRLFRKINSSHPIDIIETPEMGLAFINKIKGIRYVIRMHGGHHFFSIAERRPKEWWKVFQEKRSFEKADEFVAVSNFVAYTTKRLLNLKKNINVIYNPINISQFPKADPRKINDNELLFIGTVCEKKGIRQLVQAMPIVKNVFPSVSLRIVGRDRKFGKAGHSYIEHLKKFIDRSVVNNIEIIGEVPNKQIPAFLEEAEICVLPSHMESMGIAWVEALAMGKPFIGSKEGPGPEIVIHERTGLLANPFDPADIAEKIIYMLTHKEKARAFGEAARVDVMERFNFNKSILDNIEFYKKVISN